MTLSSKKYSDYISACGLESKLYFIDNNFYYASKILNDAEKYLPKITDADDRRKASIEINIYKWYNFERSKLPENTYLDSLINTSKKIYNTALLLKNERFKANRILFASNMLISTNLKLNRINDAEEYVKIGFKQIKFLKQSNFSFVDYYEAKGDFEYLKSQSNLIYRDSALMSYKRGIKIGEELNYTAKTKDLYAKLAKVYKEKQVLDSSIVLLEKSQALKDTLDVKSRKSLNTIKEDLYSLNNDQKNIGLDWKSILLILFVIIFLVAFLILIYFKRIKNNENDKSLSSEDSISALSYLVKLAYENNELFYISFLEKFPSFGENLIKINQSIKPSDIEFCALIKLNIDIKQIAVIKNISVRAVEAKKYRIRKKLSIPSQENIYIWMRKIS